MKNLDKISTWLVFCFIAITLSSCVTQRPQGPQPQFEWDLSGEYATSGTSFALEETSRGPSSNQASTDVHYQLRAKGFTSDESLTLWRKDDDSSYINVPVILNEDNLLTLQISEQGGNVQHHLEPIAFMASGYVPGQAQGFALVSEKTDKRAHAKVIPHPIRVEGKGGCSIEVELLSKSGHLFALLFRGFEAGEEVKTISEYKDERYENTTIVPENQKWMSPILYGGNDRGSSTITVISQKGTVSLSYNVGRDALVAP